jgi:hypothetical protein
MRKLSHLLKPSRIIKLNEKIESMGSIAKVLSDPQGTTVEAHITFVSISA